MGDSRHAPCIRHHLREKPPRREALKLKASEVENCRPQPSGAAHREKGHTERKKSLPLRDRKRNAAIEIRVHALGHSGSQVRRRELPTTAREPVARHTPIRPRAGAQLPASTDRAPYVFSSSPACNLPESDLLLRKSGKNVMYAVIYFWWGFPIGA